MNIFEMENMVKGLPDEILQRELASPSDPGRFPQWLTMSEVMRRKSMRESFQAKNAPQGTVKDQVMQEGIAAAMPQGPQGGPPMGPPPGPQGAPVAAYGGGQMPYRMAGGGSVPQPGGNPQVFQQFMQRNFGTPQGLATNIGMLGGALLGGPLGSVAGANIGSYLGSRLSTPAQPMSNFDFARYTSVPFDQTDRLISAPPEPPPFVDGMYSGGQVPGTVYMQAGQTVPRTSRAQRVNELRDQIQAAILQGAPKEQVDVLRSQLEILTAPAPLTPQAQDYQTFQRIREAGVFPQLTTPALEMAAPDFSAQLNAAMQPAAAPDVAAPSAAAAMAPPAGGVMPVAPAQNAASMISEITSVLPAATRALSGMNAGIPDATRLLRGAEPVQAQYEALIPNLSPFIQQVEQRGKESVQRYEQSIKDIENRMKQERLGAVLTTLGANLMAGEGALGLEKAGLTAQQIGKEMRQEVAAERRALDAAREGTADKVLGLQLQQVTADAGAKRDFLKANDEFRKLGIQIAIDQGKEARAAQRDMNQLALNLASNTITRLKSLDEQNALNTRSFVNAMSAESDTVLKLLEQMVITDPNEKIKKYNQLMESKIRGYGALYPNIDISSVISAFKQDTGGTGGTGAQSSTAGGNWGEMRVR